MGRDKGRLGGSKRRLQRRLRRMKAPGDLQEHRHVTMDAPLAPGLSGAQRRKRGLQVDIANQRAVPPLHDLMQVDAVIERRERFFGVGIDLGHSQRRAQLQLSDPDAGFSELREGARRLLEFHRTVADIIADAEMAPQRVVSGGGRRTCLIRNDCGTGIGVKMITKERDRFLDGLKKAAWLGLEGEHDLAAGSAPQ